MMQKCRITRFREVLSWNAYLVHFNALVQFGVRRRCILKYVLVIKRHLQLLRLNMPIPRELSIKEVNDLIDNINVAMDNDGQSQAPHCANSTAMSATQELLLHLEFPSEIWAEFLEYCTQNELDPARQIREAVASYYLNLLQVYKARLGNSAT